MFGAVDAMRPLIDIIGGRAITTNEKIANSISTVQLLYELREEGGRLGSALIVPLISRRALTTDDRNNIAELMGRLDQLHVLLGPHILQYARDPEIATARVSVDEQFFGKSKDLVASVVAEGAAADAYSLDAAAFTQAYVPELRTVETLRDNVIKETSKRTRREAETALVSLAVAVILMAAIMGLIVLVAVSADRNLFRPLLQAKDQVIALASGDTSEMPVPSSADEEVGKLFDAVASLRKMQCVRDQLESERELLSRELKQQAETDGLTGLLNRRALDMIGQNLANYDPENDKLFGLILFDIDHFKLVNDNFGHSAGDCVLREVANRMRLRFGVGDTLARFGGEEFAILVDDGDEKRLQNAAENMRHAIMDRTFDIGYARMIPVTASFGISVGRRGVGDWKALFEAADNALYRAKNRGRNLVVAATAREERPQDAA
jgi:diguanylate cyclase (GGDEF)-like protein